MKENERQRDRERGREQIVGPVTKSVPSKQSKTCGEYLRCVCVCVRVRECVCVSVRKRARERDWSALSVEYIIIVAADMKRTNS